MKLIDEALLALEAGELATGIAAEVRAVVVAFSVAVRAVLLEAVAALFLHFLSFIEEVLRVLLSDTIKQVGLKLLKTAGEASLLINLVFI